MAADCATAMSEFGHERFYIYAHDRGARVAYELCIKYPTRLLKALLLEIAPTLTIYSATDMTFASAYHLDRARRELREDKRGIRNVGVS